MTLYFNSICSIKELSIKIFCKQFKVIHMYVVNSLKVLVFMKCFKNFHQYSILLSTVFCLPIYISYVYLPKCINLHFSFFLIPHTHITQFISINDKSMMKVLIKSKIDRYFTLKGPL